MDGMKRSEWGGCGRAVQPYNSGSQPVTHVQLFRSHLFKIKFFFYSYPKNIDCFRLNFIKYRF